MGLLPRKSDRNSHELEAGSAKQKRKSYDLHLILRFKSHVGERKNLSISE